ncbi:hypothetical protein NKH60_07690 [Mesorhizobium sp. M1006]
MLGTSAGPNADAQYLFSEDMPGHTADHRPRHAKTYRNFGAEYERLQRERIAAYRELVSDVQTGAYPSRSTWSRSQMKSSRPSAPLSNFRKPRYTTGCEIPLRYADRTNLICLVSSRPRFSQVEVSYLRSGHKAHRLPSAPNSQYRTAGRAISACPPAGCSSSKGCGR